MRPTFVRSYLAAAAFTAATLGLAPGTSTGLAQSQAAAGSRALRLVVAPTGNEARFLVKEQLVGFSLPNDAVGVTSALKGQIVTDASGKVIPAESEFLVDLATLTTDEERRDRYIKTRTLETDKFPTLRLVVTELRGLTLPLPASGSLAFELVSNVTVKEVSKPVVWQVKATVKDGTVTGRATTRFTFADFNLTKPSVSRVLGVEDDIRLEYDFNLTPSAGS
jgi:polyisoprenoid-binding protein YceI